VKYRLKNIKATNGAALFYPETFYQLLFRESICATAFDVFCWELQNGFGKPITGKKIPQFNA
jgi:hypothetical protein